MPMYFFNLVTPRETITDASGTELPDEASAREHARFVARELMRHREPSTRSWRLAVTECPAVTESARRPCFGLLFASVDSTIDHLTPELRASVETLCSRSASLSDAIREVRSSILEAKATMARADGRPYLASRNGCAVDGSELGPRIRG
jgi:hypothetical protein